MTNNNNININNFLLIMKKNLVYAMMSAIALTSAVSFTGCASDDSTSVDTNPTYDGKSVRTDFAFNITKASQGTRMTAEWYVSYLLCQQQLMNRNPMSD